MKHMFLAHIAAVSLEIDSTRYNIALTPSFSYTEKKENSNDDDNRAEEYQ